MRNFWRSTSITFVGDKKKLTPGTLNIHFFMVVSVGWFQIFIRKNGCFTKHPLKHGCLGFQANHFLERKTIPSSKPIQDFHVINPYPYPWSPVDCKNNCPVDLLVVQMLGKTNGLETGKKRHTLKIVSSTWESQGMRHIYPPFLKKHMLPQKEK